MPQSTGPLLLSPRYLHTSHSHSSTVLALQPAPPTWKPWLSPLPGICCPCTLTSFGSESDGPAQEGLPSQPCLKLPPTPLLLPPLTFLLSTYYCLPYCIIYSFFLVNACLSSRL